MALNELQTEKLSKLSKGELLDFIDMLQKNWWNLQNNYILHINQEYGEEAAVNADAQCFPANAKVQMFRLRKIFGLKTDLRSLMDAMILSTIWVNSVTYGKWMKEPSESRSRTVINRSEGWRMA